MSNNQNIKITENNNEENVNYKTNRNINSEKYEQKDNQINEKTDNESKKIFKPFYIGLIVLASIIVILVIVVVIIVLTDKKNKKEEEEPKEDKNETEGSSLYSVTLNENNYIKTTMIDNFIIPPNKKVKVVGTDYPYKNITFIVGSANNSFSINENGEIEGLTKEDLPLFISFNESIINGSYLFKDVKCFKTANLSKMDGTKMIDNSNMFDNSEFEEIYFGTDEESNSINNNIRRRYLEETTEFFDDSNEYFEEEINENERRKGYFNTNNIRRSSNLFRNCGNLKKIQLPPSFNVGKSARGMFKGCKKLEDINTRLITTTEIEEMESMFEECLSLKNISFSNDFLTGEIKTLIDVFKNTDLFELDISYLRFYNLENITNILDGASIKGTLKIGKYYSNDNIRDNLLKEIAKVTDSTTEVFTPSGTTLNTLFQNIYYEEKHEQISITVINIDYNINYREDENYKLYSDKLHFGLGWAFTSKNVFDLDSSVVTFDNKLDYHDYVYYSKLQAYSGIIKLNGDDLTGEGEGDDEEITISLDLLPSKVEIFTVQINSYKRNSLKDVKSAYIRISTQMEIIGTYSITQAGNNIGLLIGCFYKTVSNNLTSWYFKPVNKVIPGNVVTSSIDSIQEILHSIFINNDKRLISALGLVRRLKIIANGLSVYSQKEKLNSLYWNGTHWFADCSNLIKSIINGRDVYNPKNGTYQNKFPVAPDVNANILITKCNNISTNFNELKSGQPRLLHLKDNQGNGHVGIYLGETFNNGYGNVNTIEATTSWGKKAVIYSWVGYDGTRRLYQNGPLSENKYNWTSHGSLDQWVF